MLLGYNFERRPNSRALGTAGSVMTIGLPINRCWHSKNQFDERKQDRLAQTFGLRRLQSLDAIRAELPFLLLDQKENKKRLCSQDDHVFLVGDLVTIVTRSTPFEKTSLQHWLCICV